MHSSLDGVIVADFSRILAGPYATMLLADLGATVIKVEKPETGDDTRSWGPPFTSHGTSTYFESINRNKKSITLDLNNERDLRRAKALADKADILVENFKVGNLAQYGLDYLNVSSTNNKIIYCSISGFGFSGGKDLPGYDLLVQAMGGLMSITGSNEPTKTGVALVDVLTGLHATVGILAALHSRDLNGEGQKIEINLLSSLLSSMVNQSSTYALTGVSPTRMGNAHPSVAPYEVFQTMDQPIIIAVGNDAQFERLCLALDLDAIATDPRFISNSQRVANRQLLVNIINSALKTKNAQQWFELLTAAGIPCGPINTIGQAFDLARDLGLNPLHGGHVANPLTMSQTPITHYEDPPQLGEHTDEVVEQFNLDG